jgi:hypothetical protein
MPSYQASDSPLRRTFMTPRIYTYKVTFEEVPYWYWGVHKEGKFGELYLGSPKTHAWVWEFYTPKIQILEFFPYSDEGWEEAGEIENRLIRSDLNNPLCLNENCGSVISIVGRSKGGKTGGKKSRTTAENYSRAGQKGAARAMELGVGITSQTPEQLSKHGQKGGRERAKTMHAEKDEQGKSVNAVEWGKRGDREGKKKGGKKGSAATNAQRWRSTIDGFVGNAGSVACHNKAKGWDPGARVRIV